MTHAGFQNRKGSLATHEQRRTNLGSGGQNSVPKKTDLACSKWNHKRRTTTTHMSNKNQFFPLRSKKSTTEED
jgi:hypothetical protein